MSIERYVESIPQTNDAIPKPLPLERGPGNFLLLQVAGASVTITLMGDGVREVFANILGGMYVKRVKPWKNLRIDGAVGTGVTFFVGNELVDRDETDIRLQTSVIAGVTLTADSPADNLTDAPAVNTIAGQAALFAQNLSRRRLTVFADPGNTVTVYGRAVGKLNNIAQFPPGSATELKGRYALDYSSAAINQKLYLFEEL
jgi:hypothetical protein